VDVMGDSTIQSWLYPHIVEETSIAIIFGDREGVIRYWNKGAETVFGWSGAEAMGKSMDMIIPEKHRARHWEGYAHVMRSGVTKYGSNPLAVPALTKDGRRISIEFFITLPRDESGQVLGAAAAIIDVTARWSRDKSLRQRLASMEAELRNARRLTLAAIEAWFSVASFRTPQPLCAEIPNSICELKCERATVYFWMCSQCSSKFSLSFDSHHGLQLRL
jgi:PAS domain S-box-containing protein